MSNKLSKVNGITIDGASSKDLDDAIWIQKEAGGYELTVLISNVAKEISIDSDADEKAYSRQFSVYRGTGGCVSPMLPRSLSEDKLSLLPDSDRGVVKFTFSLNTDLDCIGIDISEAVFNNPARLNHGDVAVIADDSSHQLHEVINLFCDVAKQLLDKRRDAGSMAIYDVRSGWGTDEEGNIRKLGDAERNIGYVVVQEVMILANRLLSAYCVEHNIPILYRNHQPKAAAPEIKELSEEISIGMSHGDETYLRQLQSRIAMVAGKAEMGTRVKGHYGLNLPSYAYFTSPIRRYPDLVCHRNLLAHVKGEPFPYSEAKLKTFAEAYNQQIAEYRYKQNSYYQGKAAAEGKRNLESQSFTDKSDTELYRMLKVSLNESLDIPSSLQEEICTRIESGTFDNKMLVTFFMNTGTRFDQAIRERIIRAVLNEPHQASSVYRTIIQKNDGQPLELVENQEGPSNAPVFYCQAKTVISGKEFLSPAIAALGKKAAVHLATLSILQQLVETDIDCSVSDITSIEPAKKKVVELNTDGKNTKSALMEWCQKMGVELPVYESKRSGADHEPCFQSKVIVNVGDKSFEASGENAGSKKEAEKSASAAWIAQYKEIVTEIG